MSDIFAQYGLKTGEGQQALASVHPTELKRNGGEHMIGAGGEFNANSKKDLFGVLRDFQTLSSKGVLSMPGRPVYSSEEKASFRKMSQDMVTAAWNSPDNRDWQALGSKLAGYLYQAADREGFMRRLFNRSDVAQGAVPRIPVLFKNVSGYVASGTSTLEPQHIRNGYLWPTEFYVQAFPMIGEREIAEAPGNLLEAKMDEGQQATMAQEDRIAMNLINKVSGSDNDILTIRGSLTPANLGLLRNQILNWNLPASTMLMSSDMWTDVTTSSSFGAWFDPVSQYEVVQTGFLGTLLGMNIISDAYRVPTQRVLNQGDIYVLTSPEYLGGFTDRGALKANAIDASALGMGFPGRGWHMYETLSMGIVGGRGVSRARRIK